jgi:hypothetical protein
MQSEVFSDALLVGTAIVASTHPEILLWTDSKESALLVAEAHVIAAAPPLLHGGVEVVDVLASQLDQDAAQSG